MKYTKKKYMLIGALLAVLAACTPMFLTIGCFVSSPSHACLSFFLAFSAVVGPVYAIVEFINIPEYIMTRDAFAVFLFIVMYSCIGAYLGHIWYVAKTRRNHSNRRPKE